MVIYKFTNIITDKCYIGQTVQDPNHRRLEHLNTKRLQKSTTHFHNAIKKYGKDAFEFEILAYAKNLAELNELEEYYIAKYNSIEFGYNLAMGGDNRRHHASTIKKMGESQKAAHARRKAAGTDKCFTNSTGMTGKKQSEHQKKIASLLSKGRMHSDSAKQKMRERKVGRTWEDIYGIDGAALRRLKHKERSTIQINRE
jgi:group I intron endonuclease